MSGIVHDKKEKIFMDTDREMLSFQGKEFLYYIYKLYILETLKCKEKKCFHCFTLFDIKRYFSKKLFDIY